MGFYRRASTRQEASFRVEKERFPYHRGPILISMVLVNQRRDFSQFNGPDDCYSREISPQFALETGTQTKNLTKVC